ncbi:PAAR-like domain-containing protein, partial [Hafnia paralvei]|uniref:PAAR-like domain-containing protein n=1 Tax=Hafnia paralvei TaxID=546367 RepID=UPI0010343EB9
MADNYTARQDGQWKVVSTTPDVCKTPRGDSTPPVPYPVTANMGAAVMVVPSVKLNNCPAVVLNQSSIPQTIGDSPGAAKGVSSGTVGDVCEPLGHSETVFFGSKPMLRHNDEFWMNSRNTIGIIVGQPPPAGVPADEADPPDEPETEEEEKDGGGWLDALQLGLDIAGFIPVFGALADLANAGISAARGNYAEAAMSLMAAVPGIGDAAAAGKMLAKGAKAAAKMASKAAEAEKAAKLAAKAAAKAAKAAAKAAREAAAKLKGGIVKGWKEFKEHPGEKLEELFCASDPVDVVTGSLIQQLNVLNLPGSLPLTLSRFYRSQAKETGIFGPKWTDEWACSLAVHADGNLHFTDCSGVVLYFPIPQDGIYRNAVNFRISRYRLNGSMAGELAVFDRKSQQTRIFSPARTGIWLLTALHDHYGNRIEFIRTGELLTDIHHSDGYTLSLDWQHNQLMSIDLVMPQRQRLVTCQYDNQGFLAECDTFQFTHLWHEYSSEGYMTCWRDTDKTQVSYRYDSQGRVTEVSTPEGYYDDRFIYNDEARCTTYLDAEGGRKLYQYNEDNLVTSITDPLGRKETSEWEGSQLQSRTDALGRITKYHYNDEGDIRHVTLPGGYSLWYDYNAAGQLTRLTTPGEQIWQWAYDDRGSMVCQTDPQGRSQQFRYSDQGDLLKRIMPGGATWRWSHDALHQVRETIAPDGGITQTEQDFLGRLLSVQDPLGFTTQFRNSQNHAGPQGSIEEISRPDGVRELMSQNSEKLPEHFTDGEGKTTSYEYGAFDLLMAMTRPDGERLACRYDKLTRLTEIVNAEGESYRLTYDKAGQLIAETDFSGRTLTYEYDNAGRCIRTRFPDGT